MEFLERVADFIHANQLLKEGQPLVVGVSGGPDSVCLLDCLVRLGYHPLPVYVDHGLRSESEQEGRFVSRLAESYRLQVVVRSVDVPALLEEQGGSVEELARKARYEQLLQIAHEEGLDTIATAHQLDDQIETVLLHFLRGSGLAGLRGMKPETDLTGWFDSPYSPGKRLIRPLLAIEGRQVMAYLEQQNLDFQTDPSNVDTLYRRNRIRHELLPYLQTFNPAIRSSLQRLSKIMAEQAAWMEELVSEHWDTVVLEDDADQLVLDSLELGRLPVALQNELLRAVLSKLQFANLEPDYGLIRASSEFVRGDGRRMTLAGGVNLERVADRVVVAQESARLRLPQYPQMPSDAPLPLPVPGEVDLACGWELKTAVQVISDEDRKHWRQNQDPYRAAFDIDTLPAGLTLRVRCQGERMNPLGMAGTVKLSDLFINAGIPQPARALWPVISHGEDVLWVVGLHMADSYRLRESTARAVMLQVSNPEQNSPRRLDSA